MNRIKLTETRAFRKPGSNCHAALSWNRGNRMLLAGSEGTALPAELPSQTARR